MHGSVAETVPNSSVWVITLQDVTRDETFTQTIPYSSSHATAKWIEETPLILGTNAGFTPTASTRARGRPRAPRRAVADRSSNRPEKKRHSAGLLL
jgi:hypothetical protein